jgi:hypothetical protein
MDSLPKDRGIMTLHLHSHNISSHKKIREHLGRRGRQDHKFKVGLGYIARPFLKKKQGLRIQLI